MKATHNQTNMVRMLLLLGLQLVSWQAAWAVSDKRLCGDAHCTKIISMGKAKITYSPVEDGMLPLRIGQIVRIYSKEAGSDPSVWGIEINGRRGYANKDHIREEKKLIKSELVTHIVATGLANAKKSVDELVKPSEVAVEDTSTTAPLVAVTPLVETASTEVVNKTPVQETLPVVDAQQNVESIKETKEDKPAVQSEQLLKNDEANNTEAKVVPANDINSEKTAVTEPGFAYDSNQYLEEDDVTTLATPVADNKQLEIEKPALPEQTKANLLKPAEKVETVTIENKENVTQEKVVADVLISSTLEEENKKNETKVTVDTKNVSLDETTNKSKNVDMSTDVPLQLQGKISADLSEVLLQQEENSTENVLKSADELKDLKAQQSDVEKMAAVGEVEPLQQQQQENITAESKIPFDLPKDVTVESKEPEQANSGDGKTKELIKETVQLKDEEEIKPVWEIPNNGLLQEQENMVEKPVAPKNPLDLESINSKLDVSETELLEQQENTTEKLLKETVELKDQPLELDILSKNEILDQKVLENETAKLQKEAVELNDLSQQQQQTKTEFDLTKDGVRDKQEVQEKAQVELLTDAPDNIAAKLSKQSVPTENLKLQNEQTQEKSVFELSKAANVQQVDDIAVNEIVKVDENFQQEQDNISESFERTEAPQKAEAKQQFDGYVPALMQSGNEIQVPKYEVPVETLVESATITDLPAAQQYLPPKTENYENIDPNEYYRQLQEATNSPQPAQFINNLEQNQYEYQNVEKNSLPTLQQQEEVQPEQTIDNQQQNEASVVSNEDPLALPSQTPVSIFSEEERKETGLFATILGTVNSFWSNEKKDAAFLDNEFHSVESTPSSDAETQYCSKLSPNDCPAGFAEQMLHKTATDDCACSQQQFMSLEKFVDLAAEKVLEMSDLLACLIICAVTLLVFLFGYYCFCNNSRESSLLAKLNHLERSLFAAQKENAILKHDLTQTRQKLSSIEDNSFGSNDMVIALKREMEEELQEKAKLQGQVHTLEKELENAAEAGLELNKIVSDLLNNQHGDESIISSVEELQRQLNEQQNVILEINTNLADKSRENSELQLMLAEQNARLSGEIASLQQDNDELEAEKSNLQTRLQELKNEFDEDITKALEAKNLEIKRLQNEILEFQRKCEAEHTKWQTSLAKVEALEDCLKSLKKNPSVNIAEVLNVANARAEVLDLQKRSASLKERLDAELESKRLAEDKLKFAAEEVDKFKVDFHQCEKDKLEAQTRLEVLSNYFKEKETQLQKELSVKEAMWLKQQGETTSTVDRLTAMQEEINFLKSQNDSLRAEIEAQVAAHKAQIGTLENRAHETWLAARQSERRLDEARAEASALRRKLTTIVGVNANDAGRAATDGKMVNELNMAPSPIHMELPPPGFLPLPPFMGPPPPFMGLPPQPFVPPGELRPAPLGRIMSPPPPPPTGSGRHGMRPAYTPPEHRAHDYDNAYYDDDDDDDYDDDLDEQQHRRRRYSRGSDSWPRHRGDYSPHSPKYRSHSPQDSRYSYTTDRDLISTYDTETDFSPPPSPRDRRARGSRSGSYKAYSPPPPTASSPINDNANGKKAASSTASKEFAAINISRIEPYNSSSESNNDRRYKKGGNSGNDSSERHLKTQNGRHGKSLV